MSAPTKRQTVLVVDDDRIIRLLTAEALVDAGYDVIESGNAEDGLALFENQLVDLVLLDVMLPGMDGFEACSRLRRHPSRGAVPIVVMTGLDDRQSIIDAYEAGATDFITKPIVWNRLPYRVQYALRASAALQETVRSRTLLSRSQSLANMGSWEWNCVDDALEWSEEMHRIHASDPAHAGTTGAALLEAVHEADRATVAQALERARRHGHSYGIEFRIVRPDGSQRWIFEQTDIERDADAAVLSVRGIRRDITELTAANERIRTLASFDPLTGLANRALFRDLGRRCLAEREKTGQRCAVLVVDLDRFMLINASLGPRLGDEVLRGVSQRLRECLRTHEISSSGVSAPSGIIDLGEEPRERIARLGGDEFTLMLADIASPDQASQFAQGIIAALALPFEIDGHELTVGASIGISIAPDDGADMDALLQTAGTALRAAKTDPHQRSRFYDGEMSARVLHKLTVESDLRRAIDNGELCMFYQAKVDMRTSQIVGAEALVRWWHPRRGLVSPLDFIPVAEETGLIVPITQWVVASVCAQLAAWRAAGLPRVPVSINLDASSLQSDRLVASIETALSQHGLHGADIEFEVTESSLMIDLDRAGHAMQQLRDIGIPLSIDDFGTGYSSLTYLKRFPLDILKIDRSFVRDLGTDANDAALTIAIIAMASSLKLQIVAEGVETWEQADFLTGHGCEVAQGFLFARPQPAAVFAQLLVDGITPRTWHARGDGLKSPDSPRKIE